MGEILRLFQASRLNLSLNDVDRSGWWVAVGGANPFSGQKPHYWVSRVDQSEDESVSRLPALPSLPSPSILPDLRTRASSLLLTPRKEERSFLLSGAGLCLERLKEGTGTPRNLSRSFLWTWLEVAELFWITKMSSWFLVRAGSVSTPRWWKRFFLLLGNVWQIRADFDRCFLGGRGGGVMVSSWQ